MDLLAIGIVTAAAAPLLIWLQPGEAVRVLLGVPLVLSFPGYSLLAALFPRRGDLDGALRLILSLGLSLAIVPLIVLSLNYSPWGIQDRAVVAFISLFVALATVAALARRGWGFSRHSPKAQADTRPWAYLRGRLGTFDRLFLLVIGLATVAGIVGLSLFFRERQLGGEGFTEFYLGAPDSRGSPPAFTVGETAKVDVGIVNQESREMAYQLKELVEGRLAEKGQPILLQPGESWQGLFPFTVRQAGRQRVGLLLFVSGQEKPYRSLQVWVEGRLPPPKPPEEPPPSAAEPAVESPPYGVHVVQRGEYLIRIASSYGVDLQSIVDLNSIENPNLIRVNQSLLIPKP